MEAERGARAAYLESRAEAEKLRVQALQGIREAGWRKVCSLYVHRACGNLGIPSLAAGLLLSLKDHACRLCRA